MQKLEETGDLVRGIAIVLNTSRSPIQGLAPRANCPSRLSFDRAHNTLSKLSHTRNHRMSATRALSIMLSISLTIARFGYMLK